ncbi:MAG: DUF5110 domain-containing protein, partial [Steroidobacteraceae bacterium]
AAGGMRAVYLPPGRWMDFSGGRHYQGGTTFTAHYAVDATPVFVREGAIVPEQAMTRNEAAEPGNLIVNVYGDGNGDFDLYEDDGLSLDYERGGYALTPMIHRTAGARHRLVIGPTRGSFGGQGQRRQYQLRIHTARRPVSIFVNGARASRWHWEQRESTAYLTLPVDSIRRALTVTW